ncbi:MAG: hypothetical protein ACRD6W_01270 [Nitrososphaerales archaeon]
MSKVETTTGEIANAIVDLVDRADVPVTLAQIEREVPGFAAENGQERFRCTAGDGNLEDVIWDGMTKQGSDALQQVFKERRVAMQACPASAYTFQGRRVADPTWVPIALVPARMANLEAPQFLARGPKQYLDQAMARAAAKGLAGYRVIGPPA